MSEIISRIEDEVEILDLSLQELEAEEDAELERGEADLEIEMFDKIIGE